MGGDEEGSPSSLVGFGRTISSRGFREESELAGEMDLCFFLVDPGGSEDVLLDIRGLIDDA